MPLDAPSPTPPSNMPPPPNLKRPRQSNTTTTTGPGPSRAKRRKPEGSLDPDGSESGRGAGGRGGPVNFGVGMVKGREDEWGEPADVVTKVDFNKLPVETLYKYLEFHDLLPRWDASPWSEDPCTPPNALYTIPPAPPPIPIVPESNTRPSSPTPSNKPDEVEPPIDASRPPEAQVDTQMAEGEIALAEPNTANLETGEMDENGDEETLAPPTTRSKTAPSRRPPTPPNPTPPPPEVKRGVITLSDVMAARGVLAEKANAHWVKGLGGGQNKEGETIVNFLYKMKVGPGRLLRVYNPWPAPYS